MYVCIYIYIYTCVQVYVCMYVCMYVCIYIYIYIYAHIDRSDSRLILFVDGGDGGRLLKHLSVRLFAIMSLIECSLTLCLLHTIYRLSLHACPRRRPPAKYS